MFDIAKGDDVRDSAQLEAAVDRLPRLDVLVCAAGRRRRVAAHRGGQRRGVGKSARDQPERRLLRESRRDPEDEGGGYGRIVNIASIAGKEGNPMAGAYSSSKGAVIGLTKAIGKDVAGPGILVNCIAPAVINTPILGQISEEHIGYMTARIPLGRVGEPAEVAALICWLASEEMSFSTAACFDISGGRATY